MIAIADKKAKLTLKNINIKIGTTNIKYLGKYALQYKGLQTIRSIKEIIRIIDAKEEEKVYAKIKYPDYHEMIDYEA